MKVVSNPALWPVLLAALNPEIVDPSANDRLRLTVFIPGDATVRSALEIKNWFKGHEAMTEADNGEGAIIEGFAKRDHLRGMLRSLDECGGGIIDTRDKTKLIGP